MTPEERAQFDWMKTTLERIIAGEHVPFIETMRRRLSVTASSLGNLSDVITDGATDGQVLKYVASSNTWEPADDIDT